MKNSKTGKLVESGLLIAMALVLSVVSKALPLHLPFGGSITLLSMLPIVLLSYRHGVKWGLFSAFVYSLLQIATGLDDVKAFFVPEDYQLTASIGIIFLDYIVAYTVLGFGGAFRNIIKKPSLSLAAGAVFALALRYAAHIVSGAIFFGTWAEWFFTQEGFYKIGGAIMEKFSGDALALVYSVFYNGLYMIPEIIITAIGAAAIGAIPVIGRKVTENSHKTVKFCRK